MFSWEALTAISTAVTAFVIGATVVVGYRQIRLTSQELEHLRVSTQLDGTMRIFQELETPEFREARLFVENELEDKMKDPAFSSPLQGRWQKLSENDHKELLVTQTFEKIGTYARHGLLDTVLIADAYGPLIREMWQCLEDSGYFAARRRENAYSLENFEYLYDKAMEWYENDDPPFRTKRRKTTNT